MKESLWIVTSERTLPASDRLVLGVWNSIKHDKAALVRYTTERWEYIDNTICEPPDYWMRIPVIPPMNAVKPLRFCDSFGCDNYALTMKAHAPATNCYYCQTCLDEEENNK